MRHLRGEGPRLSRFVSLVGYTYLWAGGAELKGDS
jgi:hypothetical protein